MASDLTLKQHDTWPPLRATLSDTSGPIDLTDVTQVKLIMKSDAFTITGICTVTDAPNGRVSYTWASGDLANTGTYNAEFEITWPGSKVETVPSGGYLTIDVIGDLG